MSARPTPQAMQTAADWLEYNEGYDDEKDACQSVADWLRVQADSALLRQTARDCGTNVRTLRRAIRKAEGQS